MGKMLNAMDLTDPGKQSSFTNAQAATAIKDGIKQNGKTTMKAFSGKLSDAEIKALVAYVRSLKNNRCEIRTGAVARAPYHFKLLI